MTGIILASLGFMILIIKNILPTILIKIPETSIYIDENFTDEITSIIGLTIIVLILIKVSKKYEIEYEENFEKFINLTIGIYIFNIVFIILKNILALKGIYFVAFISTSVMISGFISIIFMIIILFKIIKLVSVNSSKKMPIIISNIILSYTLIFYLWFGCLGFVLSFPEEINVELKSKSYMVRVDGFLSARDESYFTYYEHKNLIFMKRLNEDEVPVEILAENNGYY